MSLLTRPAGLSCSEYPERSLILPCHHNLYTFSPFLREDRRDTIDRYSGLFRKTVSWLLGTLDGTWESQRGTGAARTNSLSTGPGPHSRALSVRREVCA